MFDVRRFLSWHRAFPFQNRSVRVSTSSRWAALGACLFLVLATLTVYWPARHYDFVAYDDDSYVYQNPMVREGLTWTGVEWAFVDRHANNWHPLTWLSHMADCQLFGLNAGGPHMVNVAFHCANAVLLFLLLQCLTRPRAGNAGPDFFWRNLFVAALFALHPLRVESVAWISERKDLLSGFFGLLTLLCYAQYALSGRAPRHSLSYRLAVILFICALLSKPMLVTLPLILLLLDYWPLARFRPAGTTRYAVGAAQGGATVRTEKSSVSLGALLLEKWPFFLLSAAFSLITLVAQRPGLPPQSMGICQRIETVAANYLAYIEKLFWPAKLSFLYLRPDKVPAGSFILALAVLSGVSALAFLSRRRCPAVLMGWLWFLMVMLPVCGIVSVGRLSIADRYTYLPSIGFYLMIVWGIGDATAVLPVRAKQALLTAAGLAILIVCAVLSRHVLASWQNTQTLYEHALKVDPNNYVAKQNLHIYLFEKAHPKVRPPPPESNSAR